MRLNHLQIAGRSPDTGTDFPAGTALVADGSGRLVPSTDEHSHLLIPTGTTAERVTPAAGDHGLRFNTTLGSLESWDGSSWQVLGTGSFRVFDVAQSYVAGEVAYHSRLGGFLKATAAVAPAAFSWNKWTLLSTNFAGVYSAASIYGVLDVVASGLGFYTLYKKVNTGGMGHPLNDLRYWEPYTLGSESSLSQMFVGTDGVTAGVPGFVPYAGVTDGSKFLRADGTWQGIANGYVTVATVAARTALTTLQPGNILHTVNDGFGNPATELILTTTGTYLSSTVLRLGMGQPHLDATVAWLDTLTADLNALNTTAPTSALTQAINDGLISFNNALGQGTLDLPNIV